MAESIHLDRIVTEQTEGVDITFDGTDTTVVIPYELQDDEGTLGIVRTDTNEIVTIDSKTNYTTFVVAGENLLGVPLKIGVLYHTAFVLSTIFVRSEDSGIPKTGGRLNLRYIKIFYEDSRRFTVSVTAQGRAARNYTFTSDAPESGTFSVPILSRNTTTTISISTSDPLAANISGYEWEGLYYTRVSSRR
jgi:hypothetical protein